VPDFVSGPRNPPRRLREPLPTVAGAPSAASLGSRVEHLLTPFVSAAPRLPSFASVAGCSLRLDHRCGCSGRYGCGGCWSFGRGSEPSRFPAPTAAAHRGCGSNQTTRWGFAASDRPIRPDSTARRPLVHGFGAAAPPVRTDLRCCARSGLLPQETYLVVAAGFVFPGMARPSARPSGSAASAVVWRSPTGS
jgi:hypothetical protein